MKFWHGACAFLLGFIPVAVATLPAAALAPLLAHALPPTRDGAPRLQLYAASGTIWQGAGLMGVAQTSRALPIAWSLDASQVWRGELALDLRGAPPSPQARLTLGASGWSLNNLAVTVPAEWLHAALGLDQGYRLGGTIALASTALSAGYSSAPTGGLTGAWRGAAVALIPVAPLGDFNFIGSVQQGRLRGTLTSASSTQAMTAALTITLPPERGAPPVSGLLKAQGDAAQRLTPYLLQFGQNAPDGAVKVPPDP